MGVIMSYYDTDNQDHHIQHILSYLFEFQSLEVKKKDYEKVRMSFEILEIQAMYQLFSLIQDYLPRRAKLIFVAEDFLGKKQVLREVMEYIAENSSDIKT